MSGEASGALSADARASRLYRADLAELLRLAGPVVVSRVGVMTMGLTDAVVVRPLFGNPAGLPGAGLGAG